MVHDARSQLAGLIEADETFLGGPAKGKKGREVAKAEHKSLVVGAVEVLVYQDKQGKRRERAGRLRLTLIPDATEESLGTLLTKNVKTKSRIRTDGWKGYSDAALEDYIHHVRIVGSPQRAHKRFPHIHKVFGNLKTWLNGTHHGVEPKYLPSYLDEFVFRFNRRQSPMAAFQTLLGISLQKKPLTLEKLRG
jgi:transposase-like protein